MNQPWISSAISKWKAAGIKLNLGTSIDLIADIENKIGFYFPEDFKEFYLQINGFIDWNCTPEMFSIWPIERIHDEYKENIANTFVGFCDYLINAL